MKKFLIIFLLLIHIPIIFGNNQSEDPSSKKIVGYWYMNENRTTKWIFTQDGKLYNYDKDTFKVMYQYSISHSCQNYSSDNIEYITLRDRDGNEFCFKINAINENKNGILSLTKMDNMKTILFVNDVNLK
jgi:hypothetical protein